VAQKDQELADVNAQLKAAKARLETFHSSMSAAREVTQA
jgi:hypothetical protein